MTLARGIIPQKIKGFRDIGPQLNQLRWQIIEKAGAVYRSYGFEHWDTPVLEYADNIGKFLPDADSVAEGIYSFRNPEKEPVYTDEGTRMLDGAGEFIMENHFIALRYDLTAPLARLYSEQLWSPTFKNQLKTFSAPLFRRYQYGPVYRFEAKLDPGRFREFWQLDFDSVGTQDIASDAEVCMVLSDALEAIGLERGTYRVKLNNRKIFKGFLSGIGITDENMEQSVLRIIDKADKIGTEGIKLELGGGRTDSSGARIEGLGLSVSMIDAILQYLSGFGSITKRPDMLDFLKENITPTDVLQQGLNELKEIDELLHSLGFDESRVIIDPTLVRGMSYYTGPIFEVESLLSFKDEKGIERKVGSICGGGRYDGLVSKLLGVDVPATGASIGVDRLAELIGKINLLKISYAGPVLVAVFDNSLMSTYMSIANQLRKNGIPAEIFYGMKKGLKKQLAYADKSGSPAAVLLGEDELKKGVVTIRNLKLGAQMAESITDKAEWKEKVQTEVPLDKVVDVIKEIIES